MACDVRSTVQEKQLIETSDFRGIKTAYLGGGGGAEGTRGILVITGFR